VWRSSPEAGRSGAGGAAQEDALSKAGREGRQAFASGGGVPVPGCEEAAARGRACGKPDGDGRPSCDRQ